MSERERMGDERNAGLTTDALFVAITRPPMRWGVAFEAVLLNLVVTMQVFIMTRNLFTLLLALPIHGVSAVLCARDPRIFALLLIWARTRLLAYFTTARLWKAASYSPLILDLPDARGRRRAAVTVRTAHRAVGSAR